MTNTSEDQALRKFRARHAALDVDIKLLRLRLKAGFNPSQPRVPAGDPDGGQWTDSGAVAARSRPNRNPGGVGTPPTKTPGRDTAAGAAQARVATHAGPRHSPAIPHLRHTVTLAGGRRFVFQTEGATQTVTDGAGNPVNKTVWTLTGPMSLPVIQRVNAPVARQAFEAGRQLYNHLSAGNTRDQKACLAFTAKEFRPQGSVLPNLSFVGVLSRAETEAVCTKLERVQQFSDEAMEEAKRAGPYSSAAVFGTAVHSRLHRRIASLSDPTLRSEQSLLKQIEETPLDFSAVRVDVLEDRAVGPICVYDLKTGRRGLSRARAIEFAARLAYLGRPIIIIEVRPYE